MSRRGSGFGVVVLLVVMVVVLLLVAKAWRSVAPTALDVARPTGEVADHGEGQATGQTRPGGLPDLGDMRRETGAHTQQMEETLREID